jgi:hypothetical protein
VSVEETAHCRANGCAEMRAFVLGQCDNKILLGKSEPPVSCICSPVYVYVHTQLRVRNETKKEASLPPRALTPRYACRRARGCQPTDKPPASRPCLCLLH